MQDRIVKGNWKRVLCYFVGHDKELRFAAPNVSWSCKRCRMDYFKKGEVTL